MSVSPASSGASPSFAPSSGSIAAGNNVLYSSGTLRGYEGSGNTGNLKTLVWNNPNLKVDLSGVGGSVDSVEGFSINQLREAFQVQRLLNVMPVVVLVTLRFYVPILVLSLLMPDFSVLNT